MEKKKAKKLIKLARKAISKKEAKQTNFNERKGVFVTLHTYPEKKLRGCIGYTEGDLALGKAVQKAAISAAYNDPRFPPVRKEELNKIIIEISVLTKPKILSVKKENEILKNINPRKDGLILKQNEKEGLFLPQVWEKIPNKKDFLNALCVKANLFPNCWKDGDVKIYKFNVIAFAENEPNGEIKFIKK